MQNGTSSRESWQNSKCDIIYMGYMQNCVHLKHKDTKNGDPLEILSIGGENQVNVEMVLHNLELLGVDPDQSWVVDAENTGRVASIFSLLTYNIQ